MCSVVVTEAQQFGGPLRSYVGTCGTTCDLAGQFDYLDWDFSGSLRCAGLVPAGGNEPRRELSGGNNGGPVGFSLDNCDPRTFDAGPR